MMPPNGSTRDGNRLDRVNVVLDTETLDWLESKAAQIRERTGATINRSQLIRAVLCALADARLGLGSCRTEVEIRRDLAKYLIDLHRRASLHNAATHSTGT